MDQQLKQRLVGAVVLSLLAVIFLPLAFVERIEPRKADPVGIRKPSVVTKMERREESHQATFRTKDTDNNNFNSRSLPVKGKPFRGGQPAWVIQVGSFSAGGNASELRSKLRNSGFSAMIQNSKETGRVMYRVRIGPFSGRPEAEKTLQQLQRKLSMKGNILSLPKINP